MLPETDRLDMASDNARNQPSPLLVVAAGGTGGHMFPAQALAEVALERNWRVHLWTDSRGLSFSGNFPSEVEAYLIASGSFGRGSFSQRAVAPFRLAAGIILALVRALSDKPAAVVGFGGYPAFPAMAAAWLARRPRFIHEQNSVLGRVNRFWAQRVNLVATGFPLALKPKGVDAVTVGNPVRSSVVEQLGVAYRPPGEASLRILAVGGSQGASIISSVVPEAVRLLPRELKNRLFVVLQTRKGEEGRAREKLELAGVEHDVACFFDDIPEQMAKAQLVISRAGASSIAEITAIGRPSILVPYAAAANDHQASNASTLASAGAAALVSEPELSPERLSREIEAILSDSRSAEIMAAAARTCGKPNAALELAELVFRSAQWKQRS